VTHALARDHTLSFVDMIPTYKQPWNPSMRLVPIVPKACCTNRITVRNVCVSSIIYASVKNQGGVLAVLFFLQGRVSKVLAFPYQK
jgi:hypothetical protein